MTKIGKSENITRKRATTRQRLVDAAYAAFAEMGIRAAPVELICERAGFTRGAFYSNFASKEELFLAVYEVQMGQRLDRLRTALEKSVGAVDPAGPDAVARLIREASALFMESLAADETWYLLNVEFRAQALRQPELRAPTATAEERFHDALAEILLGMLDRLGMRLAVDPRSAVVTTIALYETMLARTLLAGDRADSADLTDVLPRLFATLILPPSPPSGPPSPPSGPPSPPIKGSGT